MKLPHFHFSPPVLAALAAAALFGGSTPFAKQLLGNISPLLLAGLLYLGSGIGLTMIRFIRDRGWQSPGLLKKEWPWLIGAIVFGGILGPALLMLGLLHSTAANASLLLNLEAVLTAILAWVIFKENTDRRIMLGMLLIVIGGIVLSWPSTKMTAHVGWGSLAIAAACLCWAIDNNLTRKVSVSDALFTASSKGLVAGIVNTALAFRLGATLPALFHTVYALFVGLLGYGISLVLFVLALRGVGTARTGAYFSTAPFMGAAIAIIFFHDSTNLLFWLAAILMAMGVWLHLTERHDHEHTHEALLHTHSHCHDVHHQHEHNFDWDGVEPHTHLHQHAVITHKHPHYPDIHHRHKHN